MGGLHHLAGLCLLRDFEHERTDDEALAFARHRHALDKEIGASRGPGKFDAQIAAGGVPALAEYDRDLAARSLASGVTGNAIGDFHNGLRERHQGAAL